MPNLVKKFRAEVGFLWGGQKAPPHVTGTKNYPTLTRHVEHMKPQKNTPCTEYQCHMDIPLNILGTRQGPCRSSYGHDRNAECNKIPVL